MLALFGEGTAATVQTVLDAAGDVVTEGMGWLGEAADKVTSTPILLCFVCVGFIGTGISLLRRLIG